MEMHELLTNLHSCLRLEQEMLARGWREDAAHFARRTRAITRDIQRACQRAAGILPADQDK